MTNIWNDIYTVVINLPKDKERRLFMEEQLSSLGIPYIVLSAIDGRTFDFGNLYDNHRAIEEHGAPLTLPEQGCALSHVQALESFLHSGKKYGLILEDDVILGETFVKGIKYTLHHHSLWSYVQFNYGPVGVQGVLLWWFLVLKKGLPTNPFHLCILGIKAFAANLLSILWGVRNTIYSFLGMQTLASLVRDQYLAGCYLVTRDAARTLIALNTPLAFTADRVQNIARRRRLIKEKIYIPRITRQKRESFTSSLNNDHFGKDIISA